MNLRPVNLNVMAREIPEPLARWCVALATDDLSASASIREQSGYRMLVELSCEAASSDQEDGESSDCCGFVYTDGAGRAMFGYAPYAASDVELVSAKDFVEAHQVVGEELEHLRAENARLAAFRQGTITWGSIAGFVAVAAWFL